MRICAATNLKQPVKDRVLGRDGPDAAIRVPVVSQCANCSFDGDAHDGGDLAQIVFCEFSLQNISGVSEGTIYARLRHRTWP